MQDVDWYYSWEVAVVAVADAPVVIVAFLLHVPRHEVVVGLGIASASASSGGGVRSVVVDSAEAAAAVEGGEIEFHASAADTDDDNHD